MSKLFAVLLIIFESYIIILVIQQNYFQIIVSCFKFLDTSVKSYRVRNMNHTM